MEDRQRRIARARLLRRQGKTYDEIRAEPDVAVSGDTLQAGGRVRRMCIAQRSKESNPWLGVPIT